jgi:hypothetical protein
MRWWLGRECFAKQKCILATREEGHQEDAEDEMEEYYHRSSSQNQNETQSPSPHPTRPRRMSEARRKHERKPKGSTAWYDSHVPPFALWVAGSDDLVDGRKLLRRFERGREPHVRVVHTRIIEEYEHLDVIWAMDCIEKVGREVKEVIWRTCNVRDKVRVPRGCEEVEPWQDSQDDSLGGVDGTADKEKDGGSQSSSEDVD